MKIALYAHGGSANHGCEALARSTMKLLGKHEYTVFSEKPEEDICYQLDSVARIVPSQSTPPKGLQYLLYALEMKRQKDDRVYYRYLYRHFSERIKGVDLALAIGGDNYCYSGFTERFSVLNQALWNNKIPTVLWGCSIDPERINHAMLADLQTYRLITARESITYHALQHAGLSNVELFPDTAFLLDENQLELPKGFLPYNTVGLNISPLIIQQETHSGIVMQNCRQFIGYILDKTSMSIALIPHVVWKGNDDRDPLGQLYSEYAHTGRVLMIEDHDAPTLKGYIRRCRFLVAARTHASIAGYSTGVPTLVLGYSVKSRGIAKDLLGTNQGYVLPVQDISNDRALTTSFGWLMEHEAIIRAHYDSFLPQYKDKLTKIKDQISLIGKI